MGWFKKKSKNDPSVGVLAERIAGRILAVQRSIADKLNSRAKNIPLKKLMMMLCLLALAFGSYSLWLLLSLFR